MVADQTAAVGDFVFLDGGQSQPDPEFLVYLWSFLSKQQGSAATLSDSFSTTDSQRSFEADVPGQYVIQLIVNDAFQDSAPDTVVALVQEHFWRGQYRITNCEMPGWVTPVPQVVSDCTFAIFHGFLFDFGTISISEDSAINNVRRDYRRSGLSNFAVCNHRSIADLLSGSSFSYNIDLTGVFFSDSQTHNVQFRIAEKDSDVISGTFDGGFLFPGSDNSRTMGLVEGTWSVRKVPGIYEPCPDSVNPR